MNNLQHMHQYEDSHKHFIEWKSQTEMNKKEWFLL